MFDYGQNSKKWSKSVCANKKTGTVLGRDMYKTDIDLSLANQLF